LKAEGNGITAAGINIYRRPRNFRKVINCSDTDSLGWWIRRVGLWWLRKTTQNWSIYLRTHWNPGTYGSEIAVFEDDVSTLLPRVMRE